MNARCSRPCTDSWPMKPATCRFSTGSLDPVTEGAHRPDEEVLAVGEDGGQGGHQVADDQVAVGGEVLGAPRPGTPRSPCGGSGPCGSGAIVGHGRSPGGWRGRYRQCRGFERYTQVLDSATLDVTMESDAGGVPGGQGSPDPTGDPRRRHRPVRPGRVPVHLGGRHRPGRRGGGDRRLRLLPRQGGPLPGGGGRGRRRGHRGGPVERLGRGQRPGVATAAGQRPDRGPRPPPPGPSAAGRPRAGGDGPGARDPRPRGAPQGPGRAAAQPSSSTGRCGRTSTRWPWPTPWWPSCCRC